MWDRPQWGKGALKKDINKLLLRAWELIWKLSLLQKGSQNTETYCSQVITDASFFLLCPLVPSPGQTLYYSPFATCSSEVWENEWRSWSRKAFHFAFLLQCTLCLPALYASYQWEDHLLHVGNQVCISWCLFPSINVRCSERPSLTKLK